MSPSCAISPGRTRHGPNWKALGPGLGLGKAQAAALQLFRRGSEAVLPRAQGAGRAVPRHRVAVRGQAASRHRAGLASDVRFFRIERDGAELIGQFYLDLYARETKRGGAWMDEAITRRRVAAGVQTPGGLPQLQFPGAGG
jgi:hypothetical protein